MHSPHANIDSFEMDLEIEFGGGQEREGVERSVYPGISCVNYALVEMCMSTGALRRAYQKERKLHCLFLQFSVHVSYHYSLSSMLPVSVSLQA